jgi:hypothetical protein
VKALTDDERSAKQAAFLSALRSGTPVVSAARDSAGVSEQAVYRWRRRDPEFQRAWDIAYNMASQELAAATGYAPRGRHGAALRQSRTLASKRQGWIETVPRGSCGVAGCGNAACPFEYGECHCGCSETTSIAKQSDQKRSFVKGEPYRFKTGHGARFDTLAAADRGSPLLAAVAATGLTQRQISLGAGLSEGVVNGLVGVAGYRVATERCRAICDVLGRELGREPEELLKECFIAELAPPAERRPDITRRRTRAPLPRHARYDGRHLKEAARCAEAEVPNGLTERRGAREILRVQPNTLNRYRQRGLIKPERVNVGPLRATIYSERELKRLAMKLRQSNDPRRARLLSDPVYVRTWSLEHGASKERARELADLARARKEKYARFRVEGRPKSAGPPDYHFEWAEMFAAFKAALDEQYIVDMGNGFNDPPPTNLGVALLVAQDHPGGLTYDPSDFPDNAARTVWKAVKPLLKPVTETRVS